MAYTDSPPQDSTPSLTWMKNTMEIIRNKQPSTDPAAELNIPYFMQNESMSALCGSSVLKLFVKLMASLRLCAMREEKRKKLNEMISKTMILRTISTLALHDDLLPAPPAAGTVREKPMKIATVKSEFTFTMPSSAVTWTAVFDLPVVVVVEGGAVIVISCWLTGRDFDGFFVLLKKTLALVCVDEFAMCYAEYMEYINIDM